jgi:hypothetical protein
VFIFVEFASVEEARAGRERLLQPGVLDRFAGKDPPVVIDEADLAVY